MAEQNEAVKKALADDQARTEQSRKEATEKLSKGKPTPTQEENDRAKLGEHVVEKEDDGSGPDPHNKPMDQMQRHGEEHRASTAEKPSGGGYQTRQTRPAPRTQSE